MTMLKTAGSLCRKTIAATVTTAIAAFAQAHDMPSQILPQARPPVIYEQPAPPPPPPPPAPAEPIIQEHAAPIPLSPAPAAPVQEHIAPIPLSSTPAEPVVQEQAAPVPPPPPPPPAPIIQEQAAPVPPPPPPPPAPIIQEQAAPVPPPPPAPIIQEQAAPVPPPPPPVPVETVIQEQSTDVIPPPADPAVPVIQEQAAPTTPPPPPVPVETVIQEQSTDVIPPPADPAVPVIQEQAAPVMPPPADPAVPVIQEQATPVPPPADPAVPVIQEQAAPVMPPPLPVLSDATPDEEERIYKEKSKSGFKISVGAGGIFGSDFGGGISTYAEEIEMPYAGFGGAFFFDAHYAAIKVGYSTGGGKWKSNDKTYPAAISPDKLERSQLSIGAFVKYPIALGWQGNINLYPTAGIDYEMSLSSKIILGNGHEIPFDGGTEGGDHSTGGYKRPDTDVMNALWFKFGCGLDYGFTQSVFLRSELLYGFRTKNKYEEDYIKGADEGETITGHGLTIMVGVGFNF